MSQRTVAVVLKAQVDNYLSNMTAAERRTLEVERAMRTATQRFEAQHRAIEATGKGFLVAGGLAAAGLALAIKASAEYGGKLAQLQSLSHASQGEMAQLSDAAMKQGRAFGQSALDVADAEIELTKAGRSTAQMLGGDLKGALAMAAAGQLDVAKATQIGVTAVTQFADSGATIPHVADLLAAGADKALGSVEDLGMALNQGGLVAAQMGLNVDQTVGTLSAFAQAGLLGSDAGTSFKTMLLSLQSPSQNAQALLDKYNITAYDSKGAFVGITDLAGQLHDKLHGVSQAQRDAALSTIFGTDAIRAANVLYKQGAGGIQGWIDKVNDAGFAEAQAAGKLNSLQGDLQKLSAAWENDLIKSGQASDGFLRGRVQSITSAVEAVGDMPPALQTIGATTTAAVAGVGLFGGALLLGLPKIAAFKNGLKDMNLTGRQAAGIFGKGSALLLGVGAVVSGFAALAEHGTASEEGIKKTGQAIKQGWAGMDQLFGSAGTSVFAGSGMKNALQQLTPENGSADVAKFFDGITGGITKFSAVYKGNEATFDAMGQQLAGLAEQDYSRAASSFSTLVDKYHLGAREQAQLLEEMPAYRDQLAHMATQAGVSTSKQSLLNYAQLKGADALKLLGISNENAAAGGEQNAAALKVLAGNADSATSSVDDLVNAIKGLDHGQLSARGAARAMEKAIDDAAEAAKKNGKTLDITTEKGRNNQAALDGIADAAKNSAAAYTAAGGSAKGAQHIIDDGKKAFTDAARAMGLGADKAAALAEKLLGIPGTVNPYIGLSGAQDAITKAANLKSYIEWLKKQGVVNVAIHADEDVNRRLGRAGGGDVPGRGPKGFDSVPAMLAPGEHVWTSGEVDAVGGQGAMYRIRAAARRGALAGLAAGGPAPSHTFSESGMRAPRGTGAKPFGGIWDQQLKAANAKEDLDFAQDQLDAARRRLRRQETAASNAQKALEKARDDAAEIHGKGTAAEKHAAEMHARDLAKAAKTADDRVKATEKRITSAEKERDEAKQARADANAAAAQIRLGREDFQSAEIRDPNRRSTDPLAYVDQLRQMSRDADFSPTRRKAMDAAARQYEQALVTLGKSSEEAAKNLDTLKQSSAQMHDSIRAAITGGGSFAGFQQEQNASFQSFLADYQKQKQNPVAVAGGWQERNGIRFQTYTTNQDPEPTQAAPTAAGIGRYYSIAATRANEFAAALRELAGRGLSSALLAELAGMGTEAGTPIAQAILAGSADDLAAINHGYTALGAAGDAAGTTVADANFAKQIAAADQNAKDIQATITTDGEALRKLIARAFGLKGYATGTNAATPGLHWVGEDGPELLGFRGGEKVLNAGDSARWIRGAAGGGGGGQTVRVQVAMPRSLDLVDAGGGLISTVAVIARDVAVQEIAADAMQDAVLMAGGAA